MIARVRSKRSLLPPDTSESAKWPLNYLLIFGLIDAFQRPHPETMAPGRQVQEGQTAQFRKLLEEHASEHRSSQQAALAEVSLDLRKAIARQADDSQSRIAAVRVALEETESSLRTEIRRSASATTLSALASVETRWTPRTSRILQQGESGSAAVRAGQDRLGSVAAERLDGALIASTLTPVSSKLTAVPSTMPDLLSKYPTMSQEPAS